MRNNMAKLLFLLLLLGCIESTTPKCQWIDPKLLDGKGDYALGQYLKIKHNTDSFYRLCENKVKVISYDRGFREHDQSGWRNTTTGCVNPYLYWLQLYCPATGEVVHFQYNKHLLGIVPFKVIE